MPRLSRLLALASSLLLASTIPGSVALAQETIASSACHGSRQAHVNLRAKVSWTRYRETYNGGGDPTISHLVTIEPTTVASVVVFNYCVAKNASGEWVVVDGQAVTASNYLHIANLDGRLIVDGVGFAVRPVRVHARNVTVHLALCRENTSMKFLKGLISLPIPGLPYAFALGGFIANWLPEDNPTCGTMTTDPIVLPLIFKKDGDTTVASWSKTFWHKVQYKLDNCMVDPRVCYDVDEYDWTITPF